MAYNNKLHFFKLGHDSTTQNMRLTKVTSIDQDLKNNIYNKL